MHKFGVWFDHHQIESHIYSVHFAVLLDVWGACQCVISGQTAGVSDKLKVNLFGNHLIVSHSC
jgi:hypothetical protein